MGKPMRLPGRRSPPSVRGILSSLTHTRRVGCAPGLRIQRLQSVLGALYVRAPEIDVEAFTRAVSSAAV
jgi:hypothetical protein